jgi:hypothetical protein
MTQFLKPQDCLALGTRDEKYEVFFGNVMELTKKNA